MSTIDTASEFQDVGLAEAEASLTSETPCQKEPARQAYDSDATPHAMAIEEDKAMAEPSTLGGFHTS
jgi:hypothetical protein